ncbi:P-loop containing nucleoside triphosphate hydrolase protein [Sphaerosporella brunnea]|uniref:P-loop containing nucleoside triphosphate hydrolase protein n=1 Tax=Sphaerosporella brunnea TaxID=1250544 RepID=A0A5J5ETZ1_9PEZI|nr:P-loop containing nucleoside triphosphate hydrolase protein [Sphaerosporella brunnea]
MSEQQRKVLEVMRETNKNIKVVACPGSGKTTVALHMASKLPNRRLLLVLYNQDPKAEIKEKAKRHGLENIAAYNYHSLGYTHYGLTECATDEGLKRILSENLPMVKPLEPFDTVVLDEQQDMKPVYYEFMKKVLRDAAAAGSTTDPTLVALGDPHQAIYGFSGANYRYLTMADHKEVFGTVPGGNREWVEINFPETRRLPARHVEFLNEVDPSQKLQASGDHGHPGRLRLCICDKPGLKKVIKDIQDFVDEYGAENVMILTSSVRYDEWVQYVTNQLSYRGIPVSVPVDSESRGVGTSRAKKGKLLVSTPHKAKGLERQCVIVFGCSSSTSFGSPGPDGPISPSFWVAITRSRDLLYLVRNVEDAPLPALGPEKFKEGEVLTYTDLDLREVDSAANEPQQERPMRTSFKTTTLTRFLEEKVLSQCRDLLSFEQLSKPHCDIQLETEMPMRKKGLWEAVENITRTAIPAIYALETGQGCGALQKVFDDAGRLLSGKLLSGRLLNGKFRYLRQHLLDIKERKETENVLSTSEILFLANLYGCMRSGYIAQLLNVPLESYSWLPEEKRQQICRNMEECGVPRFGISHEMKIGGMFEVADPQNDGKTVKVTVKGQPNILRNGTPGIWTIFTGVLSPSEVLKATLEAAILEQQSQSATVALCFVNPLTGEALQAKARKKGTFLEVVQTILLAHCQEGGKLPKTDEEFLEEVRMGLNSSSLSSPFFPAWVGKR